MQIGVDIINGVAIGIEYVGGTVDYPSTVIVDILFLRILFQW